MATNETLYRGFRIVPTDPVPPIPGWRDYAWTWVHDSYDGPGDHRLGFGRTEKACRADVDEYISEEGCDDDAESDNCAGCAGKRE